jgi:transposase
MERPMSHPFDASRSLTVLEQDSTIIAVIEMSQSKWLVSAVVPGIKRQPLKKLDPDEEALRKLLHRWRNEADQAGREIKRIVVAYEAGRDGFWLARWLQVRDVEAYVIHPASIAVSREHRRAKTDRLDTELLMRVFLGWLRGEKRHCSMVAIPTAEEEDAKRPNRERGNLVTDQTRIVNQIKAILARFGIRTFRPTLRKAAEKLDALRTAEGTPLLENTRAELRRHLARLRIVREQIRAIEHERLRKLASAPAGEKGSHAMVRLIARVLGVGVETADMLVNEVLARHLRDRKAVARYAGLTGSPDESGRCRRERGLARAGNARVRCGMIQLAWRVFSGSKRTAPWLNGSMRERPTNAAALARR